MVTHRIKPWGFTIKHGNGSVNNGAKLSLHIKRRGEKVEFWCCNPSSIDGFVAYRQIPESEMSSIDYVNGLV